MNTYLIVGLGIFGRELALDLIEKGAEVIAVDDQMERVEEIQDMVTYAIRLDAIDERALSGLGVQDVDMAVVCIGENFEANLLAAVNLLQLGVKKVASRAANATQEKILRAVGVHLVISPEIEAAERLSYRLVHSGLLDISFLGGNSVAAKIRVPKLFIGKTPAELELRRKYDVNLTAIHHIQPEMDGKQAPPVIDSNPAADVVFQENDILVLIGQSKNIQKLSTL